MSASIRRITAPSILLVEDNPLHVRLVSAMLGEVWPGFDDLTQARRLDEALEKLDADPPPDCVLLDLLLPDADGLEAVKVMLASRPEVPVVVLSSHADEETALRAVGEGAQDYLVKGAVDAAQLARAIWFAIYRHQARVDSTTGEVLELPVERLTAHTVATAGRLVLAVAVVDTDGIVVHAAGDAGELFGRPLHDLVGSSIESMIDTDDIEMWRNALRASLEDSVTLPDVEARIANGSGVELAVEVRLTPVCGSSGDVDAVVVTFAQPVEHNESSSHATYVAMSDFNG